MEKKKESPEKVTLKREMGLFGGMSIIGGIVIGSGIFYLGSYVLQRTNMSMGLALLCWIVGGIGTIAGFVITIICIVKALKREYYEIPFLGKIRIIPEV